MTDQEISSWRTNDMAMAAWLKMHGHTPQEVAFNDDSQPSNCYWIFLVTSSLVDLIDTFQSQEAWVRPQEYNKMYAQCKTEMYEARAKRDKARSRSRREG